MHSHHPIKLDRIETIDALRGFAALAVLIYHARAVFWVGTAETFRRYGLGFHPDAWLGYASFPFSVGNLGVVLFFVLSGYCIHRRGARNLARNSDTKINYREFFIRRFWRIYPTYVAALVITAAIDWWIGTRTGAATPAQDNSLFAFCISLLTLQGYLSRHFGSNGVFWTLAMEVHLYLAYPILYWLSRIFNPQLALKLSLAAGLVFLALDHTVGLESRLPFRFSEGPIFVPFWFSWATGFYLAEIEAGRVRDYAASTWRLLMISGFLAGLVLTLKGYKTEANIPWALFFAGFVRWSLQPKGRMFWNFPTGTALAAVGVFSYSLYAIHAPLLNLFQLSSDPHTQRKYETLWPCLAAAVAAIALSWVFFRLVEYHSLKKRSPIGRTPPQIDHSHE